MAKLPRGIQVVQWHNDDKSKSVRYRVRIQRKDFKSDKLFDTQAEAESFPKSIVRMIDIDSQIS